MKFRYCLLTAMAIVGTLLSQSKQASFQFCVNKANLELYIDFFYNILFISGTNTFIFKSHL